MSVRQSLLAILTQGPCYGYQLRAEYARRTGAAAPNVGQIYTTLERLERDGLVRRRGADERGHMYWGVTDAGADEAERWFDAPDPRGARDDLVHKIALAATLPGVDAARVVAAQRDAAEHRRGTLAVRAASVDADDVPELVVALAARAQAEADARWLDEVAVALGAYSSVQAFGLSEDRPRRGRPGRERAQAG